MKSIYNLLKLLNSELLNFSYKLSLPFVIGFPEQVMVEPASVCNLNCVLCPISKKMINRDRKYLTFEVFKKIFSVPRFFIKTIAFWNFGEPFLNKELPEMISFVSSAGVKTDVSTNGLIFNKEFLSKLLNSGLSQLIISLDTYDKKKYSKYRVNGDFDILVKNVKKIIDTKKELKSETKIILQFLVTKHNQNNINKIKEFGKKFKADRIIIKTIGMGSSFKNPSKKELEFIPTNSYRRYNNNLLVKKNKNKKCEYVWKRAVITSDAKLLPCCRDQISKFNLGDVNENSLIKEFNNKYYKDFRKNILSHQKLELMCLRCPDFLKSEKYIIGDIKLKTKND